MSVRLTAVLAAAMAIVASAGTSQARAVPVQLRAADGIALAGAVYDAAEPTAGIVLVHMYSRTKDDWRALSERLQHMDITALAIDIRGHGGSSGSPAPAAAMALDVQAAVSYLSTRIGGRAVAIVGASLGASLAIMAAAELPQVRAVALVSPVSDYRGVRLDAALKKYGPRPLLLLASSEDPYALRTVRGMVSDATAGREQRLSSIAAHGSLLLDRDPEIAAALVDWLRRTLLS